jgi:hypothetical protein
MPSCLRAWALRPSGSGTDRAAGSANPRDTHPLVAASRHDKAKPGLYSIDSHPFATIYLDGHYLGVTPIIKYPVTAGHHRVRAVLEDGRSRDLETDIASERAAAPVNLAW